MTALWHSDGSKWQLLEPAGFPAEQELHDLVRQAPQLLPLAGQPTIAILGSEVSLGGNYADLIGVEPTGRLVIIEVKLRRNQEARRAVVAQALSYAAYLQGLTLGAVEGTVLGSHLANAGYTSIDDAMQNALQGEQLDRRLFRESLAESLALGAFRIVFVLDDAPPELARLVEYLEHISTDRLLIDLTAVAQYQVGASRVVVPTRVEAERRDAPAAAMPASSSATASAVEVPGVDAFVASIASAPSGQDLLQQLVDWAVGLERDGLARLSTTIGVKGDRWAVRVKVPGGGGGFVTLWNEKGPALNLWRSVFEARAPSAIEPIEATIGASIGTGAAVPIDRITPELLELLRGAYANAKKSG